MENGFLDKKIIHDFFKVSIFFKGINGIWEIAVGVLFLLFKRETIHRDLLTISDFAIVKHSSYFASNYLTHQANSFSLNTKYFLAFYFFFYGVINLFLVISLLKGKLWAYPAAMFFFILFIVYQGYRFSLHHSGLLLFFTILDIALVALTWIEYQNVKKKRLEESGLPKI